MKRFLLFALVATMFAACATDATENVAVNIETPETLTVSFESDSRIQIQNGKTVWTKGDLVSVFYKSYDNLQFRFDGETGDRNGTLSKVSGTTGMQTMDHTIVAYPYSSDYRISLDTGGLDATLPATQYYAKDSYGVGSNIMVAQSEFTQFSLKNVCGWLKIQLKGEGQVVKSITLKGNNNEQVAGLVHINTADATLTLASTAAEEGDSSSVSGNLVLGNSISTTVTLDCGEGVTLGSEATAFYIALPPQTFEKGLTIDIEAIDGSATTKSTSNAITIARNTIQPMSEFTYDGVPDIYKITYTTNDGQPLDPYTTNGFGANFVKNIYDAATGKGVLKFDGTITTIPEKAFAACTNLKNIELPIGITAINAEAFSGCSSLLVMNIPQGVNTIGNKAFYGCGAVTDITIPSSVTSIGTSSFEGCGGKATIDCKIANVSSSSKGKFYKAKFTDVVIGGNITSIGDYAFYNCTSLTSITIPDSVTSIGSDAFQNCTSLTSVTIPNSLTSIGKWAFNRCTSLTSVTIPNSLTSIGEYAFYNCTSLTSVYYNGDLSAWCKISFESHSANPLNNGAKLYLNGVEATDITIPSDITEIKGYTFIGCTSLTSVIMNNRVTYIGNYAFYCCTSLTSVTISDSVTSIGSSAFSDCTSLTSATIGNRVTSIGDCAFQCFSPLTSVYYKGNLSAWCKISFESHTANPLNNGAKLYLNGVEATDITIPSDITEIKDYTFIGCTSLRSVTIPDSVTSIGSHAFFCCTSLTSITIPDSVTSIGYAAFFMCSSLKSVTIPDSVTSIGDAAFDSCDSLTSVTIGKRVTSIGKGAFNYCKSLKEVYCKPTYPPKSGGDMFYKNASGRKIYVPTASVNAYKAASYWIDYASYIVGYDF